MSQQGGAAAVSSEQVRNAIGNLEDRGKSMLTNIASVSTSMMTAVDYLSILGDKEKVATYRELMVNLGKLEHEVTTNQGVLTQFRQTYQASQEETDFKAQLEQRLQDRLQEKPYDPRADSRLREFEELAGIGGGAGGSGAGGNGGDADELGDDEDLEVKDGEKGWINDKCPLCMRSVLELEKPYKDTLGYVYEYASIMEYLRNSTAEGHKHPVAGVQLPLRARDLVPAEEVMRAKRRQRLRMAMLGADGGPGKTRADNAQTVDDEEIIDV